MKKSKYTRRRAIDCTIVEKSKIETLLLIKLDCADLIALIAPRVLTL